MGPYTKAYKIKPDEANVVWQFTDKSAGLKVSVSLVGSISIGGGGGCTAVFDVMRYGRVVDVDFPQSYNAGLLAEPYESCGPLIQECLDHPGNTGLPPGYDLFDFIGVSTPDKKADAGKPSS